MISSQNKRINVNTAAAVTLIYICIGIKEIHIKKKKKLYLIIYIC